MSRALISRGDIYWYDQNYDKKQLENEQENMILIHKFIKNGLNIIVQLAGALTDVCKNDN